VNYEEAYFWFKVAHAAFVDRPDYSEAASHLTKEKMAALDKRVAAWKPLAPDAPDEVQVDVKESLKEAQRALDNRSFDSFNGDTGQAREILKPWADQGNPEAQVRLGALYAEVDNNYPAALDQFHSAADAGDAMACAALGEMYMQARGVPKDEVLAYVWWHLAAERLAKTDQKDLSHDFTMRSDALRKKMSSEDGARADALAKDWTPGKWRELEKARVQK
jgi:TPR repeat protein